MKYRYQVVFEGTADQLHNETDDEVREAVSLSFQPDLYFGVGSPRKTITLWPIPDLIQEEEPNGLRRQPKGG